MGRTDSDQHLMRPAFEPAPNNDAHNSKGCAAPARGRPNTRSNISAYTVPSAQPALRSSLAYIHGGVAGAHASELVREARPFVGVGGWESGCAPTASRRSGRIMSGRPGV